MTIPRRRLHFYRGQLIDCLRLLLTGRATGTDGIDEFERVFAARVGRKHALAVSSGRAALGLLLDDLGLRPGDEAIIPGYTYRFLLPVFAARGVRPVAAEIDSGTFNLTPEGVAARLTAKTRLVMATHLFGVLADVAGIRRTLGDRRIHLIEDAAHALGSTRHDRRPGEESLAAIYSLDMTKIMHTYSGGVIVTDDPALDARLRARVRQLPFRLPRLLGKMALTHLEHLALSPPFFSLYAFLARVPALAAALHGGYRLAQREAAAPLERFSALQARVGLGQLERLDHWLQARRENAERLVARLDPRLPRQEIPPDCRSNHHLFVVRSPDDASAARAALARSGIDAAIRDEVTDDCASLLGTPLPGVQRAYAAVLQIPADDGLSAGEIERIAGAVNAWFTAARRGGKAS